jgi:hypothetical protein
VSRELLCFLNYLRARYTHYDPLPGAFPSSFLLWIECSPVVTTGQLSAA